MKNLTETLERHYQPLTQIGKHKDFFLALVDYVGFIASEPELLGILTEEFEKDLAEQAKIAEYEKQSLREQEIKKKKLVALTIKSGANSEKVLNTLNLLKEIKRPTAEGLENVLFELSRYLSEEKGKELVKEFMVSDAEYRKYTGFHSNEYGNFVFSKTLATKLDYQRRYEARREIELWQSIEALFTAHKAMTEVDQLVKGKNYEEEFQKKAKADPTYKFVTDHTVLFAYGDVRQFRDNALGYYPDIQGVNYLELDDFKTHARRVHLFLVNQYRKRSEKEKIDEIKLKKPLNYTLHLNNFGDLWRDPKDKYNYPMAEEGERLKILKFLVENQANKFIKTEIIASSLGKTPQYIRTELGKMKRNIKNRLRLKEGVIESKQNSGYRINPNTKILTR